MPTMILGEEHDLKLDKVAVELEKVYDRGLKGFRTAAARLCIDVVVHLLFEQHISIRKIIALPDSLFSCSDDLHKKYEDEGDLFCKNCGMLL